MKVLVTYASRHGATKGIAERVAETLEKRGIDVSIEPAAQATDVAPFDAFVVGGSAYAFHWLKDATNFVRHNTTALAAHPTWLFSSGPLGDKIDPKTGKDARESTVPSEFAKFETEIKPRGVRVFFGAWDPKAPPVGVMERFMKLMPAARNALPSGDFRDWPDIEAWATKIADQLTVGATA